MDAKPGGFYARFPVAEVLPAAEYTIYYFNSERVRYVLLFQTGRQKVIALEVDYSRKAEGEEEESEIVHHLPISELRGQIQYLELRNSPIPMSHLFAWRKLNAGNTIQLGFQRLKVFRTSQNTLEAQAKF